MEQPSQWQGEKVLENAGEMGPEVQVVAGVELVLPCQCNVVYDKEGGVVEEPYPKDRKNDFC